MNSVLRPAWFVPFDELRAVRIYQRNLPHWRQDGCTYFVAFRLRDSIPESVQRQREEEKSPSLEQLGIAYDGERGRWPLARRLSPIAAHRTVSVRAAFQSPSPELPGPRPRASVNITCGIPLVQSSCETRCSGMTDVSTTWATS
jgi:hypothetical protein